MTNPHNFHQVGKPCKAKKKKVNEIMQSKTKNANATACPKNIPTYHSWYLLLTANHVQPYFPLLRVKLKDKQYDNELSCEIRYPNPNPIPSLFEKYRALKNLQT